MLLWAVVLLSACSVAAPKTQECKVQEKTTPSVSKKNTPHQYGGWYCPDNLRGFPPTNLSEWQSVPVIEGRMPTQEETKNGLSLIYVDEPERSKAKIIDINLPRLGSFYSHSTKKEELIIVIQSFSIEEDTIVGYRFVNGGNGSARLSEINLMPKNHQTGSSQDKFVYETIKIKATQDEIWDVLSKSDLASPIVPSIDFKGYQDIKKINFSFFKNNHLVYGTPTSQYANKLFGNCYIQNDYEAYSEKLLLVQSEDKQYTLMEVVCGPFGPEYQNRKEEIKELIMKIKEDSEC